VDARSVGSAPFRVRGDPIDRGERHFEVVAQAGVAFREEASREFEVVFGEGGGEPQHSLVLGGQVAQSSLGDCVPFAVERPSELFAPSGVAGLLKPPLDAGVDDEQDDPCRYRDDAVGECAAVNQDSDSTPSVTYTYDPAGNRTGMADSAGLVTYSYDNLDRLTATTRGSDTFSYAYDVAGDVTSRTFPGALTTSYAYNGDGE
jgi:YD repeat-containing protein